MGGGSGEGRAAEPLGGKGSWSRGPSQDRGSQPRRGAGAGWAGRSLVECCLLMALGQAGSFQYKSYSFPRGHRTSQRVC